MRSRFVIGLLVTFIVMAFTIAEDFPQLLTKKLQQFKEQSPQVKLHLFFNQTTYASGDTAFFALRFLSEDMIPVGGRQLVRVELIDEKGKLVYFQNATVKDGSGSNQVVIPLGLKPGLYQWIAYSDWMKNFDKQFYFKQDFILVGKNDLINKSIENLSINFFPEGGTLVSSVSNRVVARSNKGISIARIVDEEGKEVASTSFDQNGIGEFIITPQPGSRYHAEVDYRGTLLPFPLPETSEDGLAMDLLLDQATARLKVSVPRQSKLKSEDLWMVVSARSEIYFTAPLKFENTELLTMNFPLQKLPTGICYATLFNQQGKVLAERLFVAQESQVKADLKKNKMTFYTRSNIDLQLQLRDELENPLKGEFAVTVVNKNYTNPLATPISIHDYLLYNSDLVKGGMPKLLSTTELNKYLVTQRNNRVNWNAVWTEKIQLDHSFKYIIHYDGMALDKQTQQPVQDSSLVVVYLQKNMMGFEAVTKKDGSFDLPFILDFWNEDEVFYMVQNKRGREVMGQVNWKIDSSAQEVSSLSIEEAESPNDYATFQMHNRLINRSYGFYKSGSQKQASSLSDPNYDFEDELSGADFTVNVSDYVVFPSMEELIREVIPNLQHRKVKGKATVRVLLPSVGAALDGPLYIIDGIMTRDTDYFLKFKPSDIIYIKVVKTPGKLMQMGQLAKNGVVLVHTKGLNHDELKRSNDMLPVKGINRSVPFHAVHHTENDYDRIPDFRSTLYWNPSMKLDERGQAQINFSASDDVGTFLIYIQGITSDGRPFEKVDSVSVVFNKN